jgi:hypothetical protein
MRILLRITLFFFTVILFSCEEKGLFVKCSDCTSAEPVKADLEIKVDVNNSGAATLIDVYEGNLEDGVLYDSFSTSDPNTSVSVTMNKKYTVTARYNLTGDIYIAVDSATPRVKYTQDQCENPCYFVYDRVLDLRLK